MRIAILEDDTDQADIIRKWLNHAGHTVACHDSGTGFLQAVRHDSYDLYLLDWMVPDVTGIDVLRKLRNERNDYTPAVIATAKDEEQSIVRGLEAGADDYLVKPVRQMELIARVNAILRRAAGGRPDADSIDAEPYVLDIARKTIRLRDEDINLTNREFDLAVFLFRNAGKMVSRGHLLEAIWGIENQSVSTRTVDTHVSRLRKKLDLNATNEWKLSAIYQHGYRLERVSEK